MSSAPIDTIRDIGAGIGAAAAAFVTYGGVKRRLREKAERDTFHDVDSDLAAALRANAEAILQVPNSINELAQEMRSQRDLLIEIATMLRGRHGT
jgi:hypothetical protein